ncbi:MAG: hypothetical protein ACAI35_02160 [Candidatus Methylacidiphilales bacterium]|nr:hypothetical protein [Candidatus Methylacidiphilales bacterium]
MKFEACNEESGQATLTLSLGDLKRVYRGLLEMVRTGNGGSPQDNELALRLQTFLQRTAMNHGVDVTVEEAWEQWLETDHGSPEMRHAVFLGRK